MLFLEERILEQFFLEQCQPDVPGRRRTNGDSNRVDGKQIDLCDRQRQ